MLSGVKLPAFNGLQLNKSESQHKPQLNSGLKLKPQPATDTVSFTSKFNGEDYANPALYAGTKERFADAPWHKTFSFVDPDPKPGRPPLKATFNPHLNVMLITLNERADRRGKGVQSATLLKIKMDPFGKIESANKESLGRRAHVEPYPKDKAANMVEMILRKMKKHPEAVK